MKKNIYILRWLPWSWKSTYLQNVKWVIFSSDNIREEILWDINDQSNNKLVFSTLQERLVNEVINWNEENIYVDATHLTKKSINFYLNELKQIAKKNNIDMKLILVDFQIPLSICIDRDKKRERTVWEKVIYRMFASKSDKNLKQFDKIENISENIILNNFWDNLILFIEKLKELDNLDIEIIKNELYEFLSNSNYILLSKQIDCKQKSKYHREDLLTHISMIIQWILIDKYSFDDDTLVLLLTLAIFHDIGKPLTWRTRKENQEIQWYIQDNTNPIIFRKWEREKIIENYEDIQFLWHEQVGWNIFNLEIRDNLKWNFSEEELEIIEFIIFNHLNYHKINKWDSLDNSIKDNNRTREIWLLFSKYDSQWRIIKQEE